MKHHAALTLTALILMGSSNTSAAVEIELAAVAGNPGQPQMGDRLGFHSIVRNDGAKPIAGLIAWISLVRVDKGNERSVDLEDWSALKAVPATDLAPGQVLETDWPMRLIQAGTYRVVVSAASRDDSSLSSSRLAEFAVGRKPVLETRRVLPVAAGIPLLLAGLAAWRRIKR